MSGRLLRWAITVAWAIVAVGCVPSVYDRPTVEQTPVVPRDDAAHAVPSEWWYWVGTLELADGRSLGLQLTFFEAYAPPDVRLAGIPAFWLLEKGVVAHAAVQELDAGSHAMAQRGIVLWEGRASQQALDLAVADWRVRRAEDGVSHALTFGVGGYSFDLRFTPTKPAVLHGDPPGIVRMGTAGDSYYVSHPRMEIAGEVRGPCRLPAACPPVAATGQGWFDHQWGDFRVDRLVAWDWFALQFDDGEELMVFVVRDEDGTGHAARFGSLVRASGRTIPLAAEQVTVEATGARWTSPRTGAVYPAGWRIAVPSHGVDVTLRPIVPAAEMDTRATTGIVYWEGTVDVAGSRSGVGFVELTNYDRATTVAVDRDEAPPSAP